MTRTSFAPLLLLLGGTTLGAIVLLAGRPAWLLGTPQPAPGTSPQKGGNAEHEAKAPRAPWEQGQGVQRLDPRVHAFVRELDRAWASGNPSNVFALFDFLHPQAREALGARVMMTSSGRPLQRRSTVLAAREEQDLRGDRVLGLWLSVDLEPAKEARTTLGDDEELFELLVLHEREDELRGRLLLQTTRNWQLHVRAKGEQERESAAEALGRDLLFRCRVCNYEVGSPERGSWVVLARPSFLSGCIESVEVFSLDQDLAMEVSVHPHGPGAPGDLREWLARSAALLAAGLVDADPTLAPLEEVEMGGSHGFGTTMQLPLESGARRGFRLYATNHGDATYLFAIQGPPSLVDMPPAAAKALLETFRLLDPEKPVCGKQLLAVFGGPGEFTAEGDAFVLDILGVRLPGFADWKHERRLGLGAFNACWVHEESGTSLRLIGVERPNGHWSTRAVVRYLGQLVDRNQGHLSPRPEFRVRSKLVRTELGRQGGAARHGYSLDFEYRVPDGPQTGLCRGFVCAIPMGPLLLLVVAEAMPGPTQDEQLRAMRAKAAAIRFD